MGVEIAGSELPKVNGELKTKLHEENGKINFSEVITFGSHGVDEVQPGGEATDVSSVNIAKDAVDDWPEEAQPHYFYFVKHRQYDDPELKAEFEQTEKEIQKKSQQIGQIIEDLRAKKSEKFELLEELKAFNDENSQYWAFINEKREEMKPLQNALGSLRGGGGEKGFGICSTEEELNQLIRSYEYRMQHESVSLKEEKQLMREMKELEATRPKVIAKSAMRAKIQESMGQREAIQDQVKLLGTDLDGVRKQQTATKAKIDRLNSQVNVLKVQIAKLGDELTIVRDKKNAAVDTMQQLRKKRDEGNAYFYESRTILNKAKDIALKKDVKALEEFNNAEVEKFMSQWNSSKAFRDDYEKRMLTSLDYRQLSRDGRIRNFDEKPLVRVEPQRPSEADVGSKATPKQQKEVVKTTSSKVVENLAVEKAPKESKKASKESKTTLEQAEEEEEVFTVGKPKNDNEIDSAKLKEMKKEEEKEKQRQALERKKKLQEKAAAKAALKAQKEAEKKQKEREKKMKKKTVQPTNEEEPTEKSETDEPDKSDDVEEEAIDTPVVPKAKAQQENTLRHRKPIKSRGTLPKAILKKKKSDKYWLWGSVAAAVFGVLLLVALGYKFLL